MIAFFVNQMPFKTHVHDKEFLDHFAQLKHYVNTKYLVCDIHSTFLGTYNKDCKFTCIVLFDFTNGFNTVPCLNHLKLHIVASLTDCSFS